MSDPSDVHEPDVDPHDLFERHKASGEPLAGRELQMILQARLARGDDFDMTGGDMWIHRPTFPDPDAEGELEDLPGPTVATTAEHFRLWLMVRVRVWCLRRGLSPEGVNEDLGDLYRELESTGAFEAAGVSLAMDPMEQMLYFVGPGHDWVASTPYALGLGFQTMWWEPLAYLRLDHSRDDLAAVAERLRARAEEIMALIGA